MYSKSAEIIKLHFGRAYWQEKQRQNEHEVALGRYFQDVRAIVGAYVMAEAPLTIITAFYQGVPVAITAEALLRWNRELEGAA